MMVLKYHVVFQILILAIYWLYADHNELLPYLQVQIILDWIEVLFEIVNKEE